MKARTVAALALAGSAVGLLLASGRQGASDPLGDGIARRKGVDRDPRKLLPSFRQRLGLVFEALRARGFNPLLWEGFRTPQRAAELADAGEYRAKKNSLHILGAAADVVDATKLWNAPPGFFKALGEEAVRHGLTWGGDFGDPDHVQAVKVKDQAGLRAALDKDVFVKERLA